MIHEVDSALRALIERDAEGTRDVEIVFDAPTRDWAGRRNAPTIDIYLYDIREDLRRRERGMINEYGPTPAGVSAAASAAGVPAGVPTGEGSRGQQVIVARHLPPRYFKLSYLITAWTQRPEDEHRLLSELLLCFLRYEALPAELLSGPLAAIGLPVPLTIALPPPEDRAFADVWSALGGELKPSIDIVVSAPVDTGRHFPTGPPITSPPQVSIGGTAGWPQRETRGGARAASPAGGGADDTGPGSEGRVSMRRSR